MDEAKKYNSEEKKSEFYESTRLTLLLFRCVALLPPEVTWGSNRLTRWIWNFVSAVPCAFFIIFNMLTIPLQLYTDVIVDFDMSRIPENFFNIIVVLQIYLILRFSKSYGKLVKKVDSIEKSLPPLKNHGFLPKTAKRILASTIFFVLVKYTLFTVFTVEIGKACFRVPEGKAFLEVYLTRLHRWWYEYLPFSYVSAAILQVCKLQIQFIWTGVDMLIMVMSHFLVIRFHDFNRLMFHYQRRTTGRGLPWLELQVHYTRLTRLVRTINNHISCFVLTSFTRNLCGIAATTYISIKNVYIYSSAKGGSCLVRHSNQWQTVLYVSYSTTFLVVRTAYVAAIAARIHTESREPLNALYTVPAAAYNHHLQTFMDQVYHSTVGLSGLGFFHVSKGMILSAIATLMTYELILLQFQ